jgi:hypothetical protein
MGREEEKQYGLSLFYCLLFQLLERKSMFVILHSDINSLSLASFIYPSSLIEKKSRSAKVKDGIINLICKNYLINNTNARVVASPHSDYCREHLLCRCHLRLSIIIVKIFMQLGFHLSTLVTDTLEFSLILIYLIQMKHSRIH